MTTLQKRLDVEINDQCPSLYRVPMCLRRERE
jgi:hypothetical protein